MNFGSPVLEILIMLRADVLRSAFPPFDTQFAKATVRPLRWHAVEWH
jgi:hypothetical protein